MLSEGAYGNVVEAEFKQVVSRKGGRIVASERYTLDAGRMQVPAKIVAQAARGADAVFIPEGPEVVPSVVQALTAAGLDTKRVQLLGTGLWDDPRIFSDASLQGGLVCGARRHWLPQFRGALPRRIRPGPGAHRDACLRRSRAGGGAGQDAGPQRFSDQSLTNSSGFAGIDGLFRFRRDGTNERGLAVLRVAPSGGQVVNPPPRAFGNSGISAC